MSGIDYLDVGSPEYEGYRQGSISSSGSSADYSMSRMGTEKPTSERSTKNVSSFISKLYSLVGDARHQDLVSWNPTGNSFLICNVKRFAQVVLPEYFKHGNFSSFVRLLNMYGFHKINKSPRGQRGNENEIWEFSHPQFQRNRPDLLKDIRRKAMDSEVLRRETGDMHTFFSMLQVSQADLQRQFQSLQESFSGLLQGFEETRKMQLQQHFMLRQLAEKQGVPIEELMPNANVLQQQQQQQQQQIQQGTPNVFITSPQPNIKQEQYQYPYQPQQQNHLSPPQRQQQRQQQHEQRNSWNGDAPWDTQRSQVEAAQLSQQGQQQHIIDPQLWQQQQQQQSSQQLSPGQQPSPQQSLTPDMLLEMAAGTPLPPSPVAPTNMDPMNAIFGSPMSSPLSPMLSPMGR